jgi:hypothetical protein
MVKSEPRRSRRLANLEPEIYEVPQQVPEKVPAVEEVPQVPAVPAVPEKVPTVEVREVPQVKSWWSYFQWG